MFAEIVLEDRVGRLPTVAGDAAYFGHGALVLVPPLIIIGAIVIAWGMLADEIKTD